ASSRLPAEKAVAPSLDEPPHKALAASSNEAPQVVSIPAEVNAPADKVELKFENCKALVANGSYAAKRFSSDAFFSRLVWTGSCPNGAAEGDGTIVGIHEQKGAVA